MSLMSEDKDLVAAEVVMNEFPIYGNQDEIRDCPRCGAKLTVLQVASYANHQRQPDGPTAVKVMTTSGNTTIAVRLYVTCESCEYPKESEE